MVVQDPAAQRRHFDPAALTAISEKCDLVLHTGEDWRGHLVESEVVVAGWGAPALDGSDLDRAESLQLFVAIGASLRAFDLIVFAHLLIGGLCVAAIGWRARWPLAACVLAAALFMFGGAAAGRLQHTGLIISYGMLPPAWLLLQLALDRRSIGGEEEHVPG